MKKYEKGAAVLSGLLILFSTCGAANQTYPAVISSAGEDGQIRRNRMVRDEAAIHCQRQVFCFSGISISASGSYFPHRASSGSGAPGNRARLPVTTVGFTSGRKLQEQASNFHDGTHFVCRVVAISSDFIRLQVFVSQNPSRLALLCARHAAL
ncbi:MAG: hypothetical protein IKS19_00085 [Clostridia bacterium]|nr:hypothetical protein [Clostridia bacterium]